MCNNCIHKIVCSKYIATGGVNKCEQHKEERKGRWLRHGGDLHYSGVTYCCSECYKVHFVNARHSLVTLYAHEEVFSKPNYCPNCGADMRQTEGENV